MRIVIDKQPSKGVTEAAAFIRLFPETNEEMADLMWIESVFKRCYGRISSNSGVGNKAMYIVGFFQGNKLVKDQFGSDIPEESDSPQ